MKQANAPQKKDELDRDVGIQLHFQGFDFGLKTTSRAIAAVDRLLGGFFGIPAAYAEGWRAQAEAKFRTPKASVFPELPEPVVRRVVAEELRKQENLEAIWAEAKTHLLEALAETEPRDDDGPDELSPDWLNHFAGFAEKASSETVRQLWGRVLAGEIRHPSTFSISALRVLSEADADTAKIFQEVAAFRVMGESFGISEDVRITPMRLSGRTIIDWNRLEEAGFLQGVSSPVTASWENLNEAGQFLHISPKLSLVVQGKGQSANFQINFVKITRAGSQVCSILPWNEMEAGRNAAKLVGDPVKITLADIIKRTDAEIVWRSLEILKE